VPFVLDPEVESVSTVLVDTIIPDDSLKSIWYLSKSRGSGKEPAITNLTLVNTIWFNTL
jgi:hypothetical protein